MCVYFRTFRLRNNSWKAETSVCLRISPLLVWLRLSVFFSLSFASLNLAGDHWPSPPFIYSVKFLSASPFTFKTLPLRFYQKFTKIVSLSAVGVYFHELKSRKGRVGYPQGEELTSLIINSPAALWSNCPIYTFSLWKIRVNLIWLS